MDCTSARVPYRQTNAFSNIVIDYIDRDDKLKGLYTHPSTLTGIQQAIRQRQDFPTNRELLVGQLRRQYEAVDGGRSLEKVESLLSAESFTITTAHQPNILTGPLYFIYKIVHVIKLADQLQALLPQFRFVPLYYMGSEDADIDELGTVHVNGRRLTWQPGQSGAVGRMFINDDFLRLISEAEGQLAVLPFGKEIVEQVRRSYRKGVTIQDATFDFVHSLFSRYGLVVLIPDNEALKRSALPIFKDDLLNQSASELVAATIADIDKAGYKVQANPREINLFYLGDGLRERIEKKGDHYIVKNAGLRFPEAGLLREMENHPGRFSPNVILRGLFQELILPNIAFVGGGGEIAYWLQFRKMFDHYGVPFPALVLRNSFLIVDNAWQSRISKLGFSAEDFFEEETALLNRLVAKESRNPTELNGSLAQLEQLYESFKQQASAVDITLARHVEALKTKTVARLQELEKKMLRAEKRKFSDQQRQIRTIKSALFPGNSLQERVDNLLLYYARWGPAFIDRIYEHSLGLEQEFVILLES